MQEDMNSSSAEMPDTASQRLIEECARWIREGRTLLDEKVPGDSPPHDPLPAVDLFTLYGELKGLREDIKRDLRRNAEFIEEFRQGLEEIKHLGKGEEDDEKPRAADIMPDASLEAIFDLYNRSARLIPLWEETMKSKSFILGLLGVKTMMEDMFESQRIFGRKCEARFRELSIEVTGKRGEPFNPLTMKAVDVRPGKGLTDGTVLEVAHHGFTRAGCIISYADVVVAKGKE